MKLKFSNLTNFNATYLKLFLTIVIFKKSTGMLFQNCMFKSYRVKMFQNCGFVSLEAGFSKLLIYHVSRSNISIVKYCKFGINIKLIHSSQLKTSLKVMCAELHFIPITVCRTSSASIASKELRRWCLLTSDKDPSKTSPYRFSILKYSLVLLVFYVFYFYSGHWSVVTPFPVLNTFHILGHTSSHNMPQVYF